MVPTFDESEEACASKLNAKLPGEITDYINCKFMMESESSSRGGF